MEIGSSKSLFFFAFPFGDIWDVGFAAYIDFSFLVIWICKCNYYSFIFI